MRRLVARGLAALVVIALVVGSGGCRNQTEVGAEGRLEPSGTVLLTSRGGDPVSLRAQRTLRAGDVVEVSDGGATVALPTGATLELRPRSVVVFDNGPELRNGDLLVLAQRGPQVVRSAGSSVEAKGGAVRLTQTLSLRVASYSGPAARIESAGHGVDVPPLREVAVPALGVVPGAPSPMALAADDPWDKRFLPDVVANLDVLEQVSHGFPGQVGPLQGRSVGFYRTLVPALDPESAFQQAYVDQVKDPGDVLVGSLVALLGRKGAFADRLAAAAEFRAEGAPWALVAKDQDVPSFDVLRHAIDDAINQNDDLNQLAAPPASTPTTVPRSGGRTTPTTAPTTPTTTQTSPPPTSPTTPPSTPPGEQPPPETPGLLDPVVDPVAALLDGLLGG
jgi:hypothetical protein